MVGSFGGAEGRALYRTAEALDTPGASSNFDHLIMVAGHSVYVPTHPLSKRKHGSCVCVVCRATHGVAVSTSNLRTVS
jgi:hypothetical protein